MSEEMEKKTNPETVGSEEDFAAMLEESGGLPDRLRPGQKVSAKVVSVSGDLVYIDLGGKSEGVIELSEFQGKGDEPTSVKAGDKVDAFFVTVRDGMMRLTTLVHGYPAAELGSIQEAYNAGVAVEGNVKSAVKGGFEVLIGSVRCFCPYSQMDIDMRRQNGSYVGKKFPFQIIEFKENGKNIILSRRALLEDERKAQLEKLKETLAVGADITGRVTSLQKFGAFVDLGGMDGLIPMSELSWGRVKGAGDVLSEDQEITARVIAVDWDSNRITLSLKAAQPDPWDGIVARYPEGAKVSGKIVRLTNFGAFVNLEPGIDGLIHISNLGAGRRINHPKEVVENGQEVEAYVLSADPEARRVSLSMSPKAEPRKIDLPKVGTVIDGIVEQVKPFGVFVKISEGLTGLIPNSEMDTTPGADHTKTFPPGTAVKAAVIDTDKDKGKVTLSRKAISKKAEEKQVEEYKGDFDSGTSFGTFGDLMKEKLKGLKS